MTRFENKLCPVCRVRFNDKADIVVCPVCGTPHHRACYMEKNKCALEELHAAGWSWNGRLPDEEAVLSPNESNESNIIGDALDEANRAREQAHHAEYPGQSDNGRENGSRDASGSPYEQEQKLFEEELGANSPFREVFESMMDREIKEDGVSMHELASFTASSVFHYGKAFYTFRKNKKHAFFNLSSGLFAPVFHFYRRMNFFGVIATLVMLVPSLIALLAPESLAESTGFYMLIQGLRVAIVVLLCFFSDYIYYRYCVGRIKKFRSAYDGDTESPEYYQALYTLGKPTFLGVVIGALVLSFGEACVLAFAKML